MRRPPGRDGVDRAEILVVERGEPESSINRFFEASFSHDNYKVKINHPAAIMDSSLSHSFEVTPNDLSGQTAC